MPRLRRLKRRDVRSDVTEIFRNVLAVNDRIYLAKFSKNLIPAATAPRGWKEASGASWARILMDVEQRLHDLKPEYRLLKVTATDGHQTWKYPLAISVHLLTEKIMAANGATVRVAIALGVMRSN